MIDVDVDKALGRFRLAARFSADAPVLGLFGRSGSGKTSVINAIAGILTPDRGRIVVGGETLFDSGRGIDIRPERRRVGCVFQESLLFPHLDVRSNLEYGWRLRAATERFIDVDRVVDLLGLAPLLDRSTSTLSGGEKQRVAIGRALLAQPRILLMDEPLASLDVPRKVEVLDYVERLRDEFDIPIVYVSHSVAEVTRIADAVAVLSEGRCLAVGPVEEVMGRPDLRPATGRYEAGALLETRIASHDDQYQLTTLAFDGGELVVPRINATVGERVRTRIRARDVSLATERPRGLSIVNVLQGRVTAIEDESGPVIDVQLAIGGALLTARVTRRSQQELGIVVGKDVYALVKAIAFDHRSLGYA